MTTPLCTPSPTSSTSKLVAKGKTGLASKPVFTCSVHGKNMTHNSKDCCALQHDKKEKTKKKPMTKYTSVANEENSSSEFATKEEASITQAAKLASPPDNTQTHQLT